MKTTALRKSDLALYIALLSWFVTLLGYSYGRGDHLEYLPMVFKAMDSDYLSEDIFVQATAVDESFNPRYYFIKLLAFLGTLLPLPFWALLLTLLGNWAIAWGAARAALLFYGNTTTAFLAALFCLTLPVPSFGSMDSLQADYLLQDFLSFALFVHALIDGLQEKYRRMGLLLFLSALLHPLIGLVLGGLHLALLLVLQHDLWKKKSYWLGALLFLLAAFAQLWPYAQQTGPRLTNAEFLRIYVHLRNPHHFLASHFLNPAQIQAAWHGLTVLGLGLAYLFSKPWKRLYTWLLLWLLALGGLALGAYLFVEVWPTRLWATLQGYRFLILAKWWALVLAAGIVEKLIKRGPRLLLLLPFAFAAIHLMVLPYLLGGTLLYLLLEKRFNQNGQYVLAIVLTLLLLLLSYWKSQTLLAQSSQLEVWWVLALLNLALLGVPYHPKWVLALWILALAGQLGYWLQTPRNKESVAYRFSRAYQLSDQQDALTELSDFIRVNTPADAVFLTPPGFSPLRLHAQRAIVVDFKTYAFTDSTMQDWYNRILDVYGPAHSKGFEVVPYNFVPHYQAYTATELLQLANTYRANYIIGYKDQALPGRLILETKSYKVARLPD